MPCPTASIGTKIRVHTSSNAPFPPSPPSFLGPVFRPLSRWERVRVRVDDYSVNNLVISSLINCGSG
jgi:hypothetical protein